MATAKKPSAAEAELQKAEAEAHKLHPLLSVGNDVAPITRGELRTVIEDLITMMASGKPISLQQDEKALGDLIQAVGHLTQRVQVLEGVAAPAPASPAPAQKPAPQLDYTGADELKALDVPALRDFAKKHGVDVSALPDVVDMLAEFIAAAMNAQK